MSWLEVLAVIAIIGFVIYQQFAGQLQRGKRVVLLPAILTIIGLLNLRGTHMNSADIAWLTIGAIGSLVIGLGFGLMMHLEARDGVLWGKLPLRGAWLWVALIAWRVLIMVIAAHAGAHLVASTTPLLFTLGLNRLGQAAVIFPRAMASGIPFAPEKDGRTFLGGAFGASDRDGNGTGRDSFDADLGRRGYDADDRSRGGYDSRDYDRRDYDHRGHDRHGRDRRDSRRY